MGDVAMLAHALRALKEAYPDLRVTVATRPVFRAFFTGLDLGFMDVDIKGVHHSLRGMWRLAADARRLGVDAVADVAADAQYHHSYFVVAHFHYALFAGGIMGVMTGVYYWLPKWTGHMYSEKLGKLHFWLTVISFNFTFMPQFFLGCLQPRARLLAVRG